MSDNHVIGHHNRVPWHLPADLKHFKRITLNKLVLMGRKTYESIGHALPQRINIILTRNQHFQAEHCLIAHSMDAVFAYAIQYHCPEVIVIGGADIYTGLLPQIATIYLTIVHTACVGDVYFPSLNMTEWEVVHQERHLADDKNSYDYSFIRLNRRFLEEQPYKVSRGAPLQGQ